MPAFALTITVELSETMLPVNEAASISPVATIPLKNPVLQALLDEPISNVLEALGVMLVVRFKY